MLRSLLTSRQFVRALLGVTTLAVPLALPLTSSMAQSGSRAGYDVRIRRDTYGVPHVRGTTDAAVAYGFGYAHSEDDFATIQEVMLAGRGQLATLKGAEGRDNDHLFHLIDVKATIARLYGRDLPPDVQRILDAYAAGINLYAAQHPAGVATNLLPVTGRDVASAAVLRGPAFYGLNDVVRKLVAGALPEDKGTGSNAVALAPSRAADGHTRLLFNAHQPFTGPASWYEAVLESDEGWHVAGGFFPGTPFMLGGHNAHLGWAATTNRPDLVDVYRLVLKPGDPMRYRLDGKWLPLERRSVTIAVRQGDGTMKDEAREILRARHGPVIRNANGAFALRYPTFGGAKQLLQYYRMNKARTMAQWQAAMQLRALPNINYLYADEARNIGFVSNGLYPERKEGFAWQGVVPGDRSDLIWTKLRPWDQVPQIWNPRSGWLFNANNDPRKATDPADDVDPARYPPSMGLQTDMTNRAWRSLETWGADRSITAAAFDRYKYDLAFSKRSDTQDIVTAILGADAADNADLAAAQTIVQRWDYKADLTNRSTAIVALTWLTMRRTHRDALPSALEAIAFLKKHYGRLDPAWGDVNRLRRGTVDLPLDGGPDALRAIYGRPDADGRLRAFNGDSYIMFVEWDRAGTLRSRSVHQFGAATLDPRSPHYADQTKLFADKQTKPVWFTDAQLKGHVARDYRPGDTTPGKAR